MSSLSPVMMTGTTFHHLGVAIAWNGRWFFLIYFKVNNRLLFPPLDRYRCSVSRYPAARRSCKARRTVDWDSFKSYAMVGMDGQHWLSLLARLARYK